MISKNLLGLLMIGTMTLGACGNSLSPNLIASTNSLEGEGAATQTNNNFALENEPVELASLPPVESLSWDEFRYFQDMGPLEYAARLSGTPRVPNWRVRLQLSMTISEDGRTTLFPVQVEQFNLSPAWYREVAQAYGADNVDPGLNDQSDHRRFSYTFMPIMNMAAGLLDEETRSRSIPLVGSRSVPCPVLGDCTALGDFDFGDNWREAGYGTVSKAPWESEAEPVATMVRTLAQTAGWVSEDFGWWPPQEQPEGLGNGRPWVEIIIDNVAGNGGGYQGIWIERAADDSVMAKLIGAYADPASGDKAYVFESNLCARTNPPGAVAPLCP